MIPLIVDAALTAIREADPDPAFEAASMERNLRVGLTDAVDRWFLGDGATAPSDVHFRLGRAQAKAGRTLDELMGFYRIAGQTMWRRLTEVGTARGVAPDQLYVLAGTGFGTVDEISTEATAGFVEERAHQADAAHSRRSEVLRLLLQEPPGSDEALEAAALAAGVRFHPVVAIYVGDGEHYEPFLRAAREQILRAPREGYFVGALFDPEAPHGLRHLAAAAARAGVRLAVGPSARVAEAGRSLSIARRTLVLAQAGLVGSQPLVSAREHILELLLSGEPDLAQQLIVQRLEPLEQIRGKKAKENLTLTLQACLAHPGQRKAIAHALGVHPQTVRYRMTRLRELFGSSLEDPQGRFELDLALRLKAHQTP